VQGDGHRTRRPGQSTGKEREREREEKREEREGTKEDTTGEERTRPPPSHTKNLQPLSQALARLAASRPASLAVPASPPADAPDPYAQPPGPLRRALLTLGGFYSAESRSIRAAQAWHASVVAAAAGSGAPLARAAGLDPVRFADTHALLGLHMWLALVRLRAEGEPGKAIAQALYENFSDDVEVRVRAAGVRVRVSKWLSELERMFYGAATAYDRAIGAIGGGEEGGGKGGGEASAPPPPSLPGGSANAQAALTAALLRNAYAGDAARTADAGALARYARGVGPGGALRHGGGFWGGGARSGGGGGGVSGEGGEEVLVAAAPKAAA